MSFGLSQIGQDCVGFGVDIHGILVSWREVFHEHLTEWVSSVAFSGAKPRRFSCARAEVSSLWKGGHLGRNSPASPLPIQQHLQTILYQTNSRHSWRDSERSRQMALRMPPAGGTKAFASHWRRTDWDGHGPRHGLVEWLVVGLVGLVARCFKESPTLAMKHVPWTCVVSDLFYAFWSILGCLILRGGDDFSMLIRV